MPYKSMSVKEDEMHTISKENTVRFYSVENLFFAENQTGSRCKKIKRFMSSSRNDAWSEFLLMLARA